jgi:heat shock protein HspQ
MEEDVRGVGEMKWVAAKIKWRIGHVFRHRLFGYHAVVRGWDYKCEASETCESLSLSLSQS